MDEQWNVPNEEVLETLSERFPSYDSEKLECDEWLQDDDYCGNHAFELKM